ncbi:MAG: hypothetical protein FJX74_22955, partial [Armatimonadetes bacterium]|nr:hypothetical protein [Armatimonadota bacterium]
DLATVNSVLGATDVQTLQEIIAAVLAGDVRGICDAVDSLISSGKDLGQLLDDLMGYVRDLSRLALGVQPLGQAAGATEGEALRLQAEALGTDRAMRLMTHFAQVRQAFRQSAQHGLLLEAALLEAIRLVQAPQAATPPPPPAPAMAPAARPAPTSSPGSPVDAPARRPAPAPPAPPVEVAAPQVAAGAGGLTLEAVRLQWPNVQEVLRRMQRLPVWALARPGSLQAIEGSVITLAYGAQWKALHDKLTGDNLRALEEAFSHVLGAPVEVRTALLEGEASPEGTSAPLQAAEAPPPDQPFDPVEQVKETFPGSTVVDGARKQAD